MSEFPSLAEVLAAHRSDEDKPCWANERWCTGCRNSSFRIWPRTEFPKHQADVWREACTIHTVEELDALPPDSTVMSLIAIVAYQRARTPHSDWYSTGLSTIKSVDVPLPALLIWHPDWERP